jgi:ketosteroid isomerase-like protein
MAPPANPTNEPLAVARGFWAYFDAKDYEALAALLTDDAMETDDLAQGWLRGPAAIAEHFAGMGVRYEDSHTALEDVAVSETSDTAVVTCVVDYQMRETASRVDGAGRPR